MLFNSFAYAIFLPIVFVLYWAISNKYRWPLLLGASYYFYMSWNPKYVVLILATTIVSFIAGLLLERQESKKNKKIIVAITLIICLGVLFVFKYFVFFTENVINILTFFSIKLNPITLKLLLPVGISFYTFQTLSYVIDIYRGDTKAEKNFGVYATFISFFPQLVAGPIERTESLLPQIKSDKQFDYDLASYGIREMLWGFFKKLAIADVVAVYVDKAYASLETCTGFDLIVAIFFFTIQIYCDFSGYSDIAIGTAKLFGIKLMTNFKSPYFSVSVKEFWSRWHISLSTWFRDYVYIPLGGNRCSKLRNCVNLLITFLVSGLWHGANWTFLAWGGVHGLVQVIEKGIRTPEHKRKFINLFRWIIVFSFCNLAWVFFRAQSVTEALYALRMVWFSLANPMTFVHSTLLSIKQFFAIMLSIMILAIYDFVSLRTDVIEWTGKRNVVIRWGLYFVTVFYIILSMKLTPSSFIYFQF